jgi:sec-independent protein translocase protein TatB
MMPGIGLTEMILLVVVSIVVIGPKDLPLMMRKFGKFTGKMRALAFEFQQGIDELGRQAELDELRKEVADLKKHTGLEDLRQDLETDRADMEREINSATSLEAPGQAYPGTPAPDATPALTVEQMNESTLLAESANGLDPVASPPAAPTAVALAEALPEYRHDDYSGPDEPIDDSHVDVVADNHVRTPVKQETPA